MPSFFQDLYESDLPLPGQIGSEFNRTGVLHAGSTDRRKTPIHFWVVDSTVVPNAVRKLTAEGYDDTHFTPYSGRPMWTARYGAHSALQAVAIERGMDIDGGETPARMPPTSAGRRIPPPPPPPATTGPSPRQPTGGATTATLVALSSSSSSHLTTSTANDTIVRLQAELKAALTAAAVRPSSAPTFPTHSTRPPTPTPPL